MELNSSQKEAVMHRDGPALILAGPGSGKTRVITERVINLIETGVKPDEILVITFTKAAALEMKERYHRSVVNPGKVRFGTFHSVFFMMLKVAYNYSADNILKENVKFSILKDIVARLDTDIRDENEFVRDIISEISLVKGNRIDLDNYYSPNCPVDIFKEIYEKYQRALEKRRYIDFDDMLIYAYDLLSKREDIRKKWQDIFKYILVDEFQDVNKLQYMTLKLLAEPGNNLFVVGDDDQAIYGFRGSDPKFMQTFLEDYPEAKKVTLDINYRSTDEIIRTASKLIKHNSIRLDKNIRANGNEGEKVTIKRFNNLNDENEYIAKCIAHYRAEGIPLREISVLFRTNHDARALSSYLKSINIPYFAKDFIPNLYTHWIFEDIFSYIKIALGSSDRKHYLRVINRPKRYISREVFNSPMVDMNEIYDIYEDKEWMLERLEDFEADMRALAKMKPFAAVNFIRRGIGYDDYIEEYSEYRGIKEDSLYELLDEISGDAKRFDSYTEWFKHIKDFSEELEKEKENNNRVMTGDAVILQTMHASKGLEYECVFVPDMNEKICPHSKAVLKEDMEEERRMFYVAMTRAKKHLHISCVKERFHKEYDISRFVEEIVEKK
ncbi:MAG: ATP-dependent helicase [Lachnospiraceae bacterium]|nr:ATP-dependent helicase [Lachnospiraceae bacterium]